MVLHKILNKRWPICCLLFLLYFSSCKNQKEKIIVPFSKIDSSIEEQKATKAVMQIGTVENKVKSGDLILRTGKDNASELMRHLSQQDKTYSHCGIASVENDSLFVYHAIGGEWNPDQKLRRDPFNLFCNPYENRGIGIYRYKINKEDQRKIITLVHHYYSQGLPFDMQFDLSTDNKMYCSEFVFKTIEKATKDSIHLHTTTLNHFKFVSIDNLFANPYCVEIKRIIFR